MRYRQPQAMRYSADVYGKHLFRLREVHVAQHIGELLRRKALSAAKLDLLLRAVALLPDDAGERSPGLVLPRYSYASLYDLVADPDRWGDGAGEVDYPQKVYQHKRKWVGERLELLEQMHLLQRGEPRHGRPVIHLLRDDGSGRSFDDPNGNGANSYLTVNGEIFAKGMIRDWSAGELAFYLCAMIGERYAVNRYIKLTHADKSPWPPGAGTWYAPLGWFADAEQRRPPSHVRVPFSQSTLERGLRDLRKKGLVQVDRIMRDPVTHRRLSHPRNLYTNRFVEVGREDEKPDLQEVLRWLATVPASSLALDADAF